MFAPKLHKKRDAPPSRAAADKGKASPRRPAFDFPDHRPGTVVQRKIQFMADEKMAEQSHPFADYAPEPHPAFQSQEPVIQRRVIIGGQQRDSIVDYLYEQEWGEMLSLEQAEVAGWMLGLSQTWRFRNAEDLILFLDKAYAMTSLIRSVFANGILSRARLNQGGIPFVGSDDAGAAGALAVNVLDNRGPAAARNPLATARDSMTATDRGSISVALERENDWLKVEELARREDIPVTEEEHAAFVQQYGADAGSIENIQRDNRAAELNQQLLNNLLNPEMRDRAMRTIMAVVRRPNAGMANLEARNGSYESDEPTGRIPAGAGGFTDLLIPQWFQPFYLMLRPHQPDGVRVRFVGYRQVTAYYRLRGEQIPVTVDAPDYAREVAPLLQQFDYLATHIMTA